MVDATTILIVIGLLILAKVNSLAKQNAKEKETDTNTSTEDLQTMGKEILDAIGSLGGVVPATKKKK